ncbi:MAG: DUF4142 domain-containing protein [Limisphaerales bacterium]
MAHAADQTRTPARPAADLSEVDKTIAQWPERPKLGAQVMLAKYGAPQEVTEEKLVWHNLGSYKRITVTKKEDHHDFPMPHMDFLEVTINYNVPTDKADEISKYDGSCTFDRTRGELSARCDLEGHDVLTLNLANDIVTGKKNAESARKAFGEIVVQDLLGKKPAYATALQFKPAMMEAVAFSDLPVIPGAPMRPDSAQAKNLKGDAAQGEILGFIVAVDMGEIGAAMVASEKKLSSPVAEYAKMLHQEHGMNAEQTLKLGEKINVTPLITPAVNALQMKGAGELAAIVPLEGEEFSRAYLDAKVRGHTEVLQMIDRELLPKASNEDLKKHLTETRQHVAAHLDQAKTLQGTPVQDAAGANIDGSRKQPTKPKRQ